MRRESIKSVLANAAFAVISSAVSSACLAGQYIVHIPDNVLDSTFVAEKDVAAAVNDTSAPPDARQQEHRRLAAKKHKQAACQRLSLRPRHDYQYALHGFAAELTDSQVSDLRGYGYRVEPEGSAPSAAAWTTHIDARDANGNPTLGYSWAVDATKGQTHPNLKVGDYTTQYNFTRTTLYILDDGMPDSTWTQDLNLVNAETVTAGPAIETSPDSNWQAHGYAVASVAAEKNDSTKFVGVVPNLPVHSIRVTQPGYNIAFEGDLIAGLDKALAWERFRYTAASAYGYNGGVVNISFGGTAPLPSLATALANATQASYVFVGIGFFAHRVPVPGLMVVIAAGNSYGNACSMYPGAYGVTIPGVVNVGAINVGSSQAYYSNYGSCVEAWSPGDSLLYSYKDVMGYRYASGTSFAAPVYAAVAASYREYSSAAYSPASWETIIRNNSINAGTDYAGLPMYMPWLSVSK